jgi:catechol 2,3-dioxygenase-like lactoylglutathione lyase family enzyme
MTLQVQVGDTERGRAFYTAVFGREPDFAPHHDFLEWQVLPGVELWWQVVTASGEPKPLATRARFLVDDVRAASRRAASELGVNPSAVTVLPGVVAFTDFDDPWGNRLGYYQDLAPSGEQPEPGGSVHDESLYETDVPHPDRSAPAG